MDKAAIGLKCKPQGTNKNIIFSTDTAQPVNISNVDAVQFFDKAWKM